MAVFLLYTQQNRLIKAVFRSDDNYREQTQIKRSDGYIKDRERVDQTSKFRSVT